MEEMQHAATTVVPGANGVVFHPYINGERAPHWRPDLKPALNGADTADKNDLARAAYEGVGYALLDVRQDLEQLLKREVRGLVALGGGAQNPFWMQMMSDIQDMVIKVPEHTDAAYGAALQAGLAHGAFPNAKVLGNMITYAASYEPHPEQHEIYLDRFADYDRLRRRMTTRPRRSCSVIISMLLDMVSANVLHVSFRGEIMNNRVAITYDKHIAHVEMIREDKINALDGDMLDALNGAIAELAERTELRAVVLSGRGRGFLRRFGRVEFQRHSQSGDFKRTGRVAVAAYVWRCQQVPECLLWLAQTAHAGYRRST